MRRAPELSVVLPGHRTAWALPELHRRLVATLAPLVDEFELVVVDDRSPDDLRAVAERLARSDSRIRLLKMTETAGQHRALLAGFLASRGARVLAMDADLQDPPEAVPALLDRARAGSDVVFAGRVGVYQSATRMLGSWVYRLVRRALLDVPGPASAFVLLDGALARRLAKVEDPSPSVSLLAALEGRSVAVVPVARSPRLEGTSSFSHGARLRAGASALRFGLRHRRRLRARED